MICVSIQGRSFDEILGIIQGNNLEMAEIRLDRCPLSDDEVEVLFSDTDIPLIATCRISEAGEEKCEHMLGLAIDAGAKYVDLELDAPAPVGKKIRRKALNAGTILIRSYHNFKSTPTYEELEGIVSECKQYGAEVVKIATLAVSPDDVRNVEKLYGYDREGSLVAFCMGECGRDSRVDCLKLGAPFTYACLGKSDETAPGQPEYSELHKLLYGNAPYYRRDIKVPASKSFAQRAVIAAALAEGTSRLSSYTACGDSESALRVAQLLGAQVNRGEILEITGVGGKLDGLNTARINVGESGFLARVMIPISALSGNEDVCIEGEKTLLNRPLTFANDIMAAFGVVLTNASDRKGKEVFVPVNVRGRLLPGKAEVPGNGGSQLISGLLMALPMAEKDTSLYVQDPKSIPYMFMTMDILRKFGVKMGNEMEGDARFVENQDWGHCSAINFKIRGGQKYKATDLDIEGDWSVAANFMVAGSIFGEVRLKGLDTSSVQADLSILDILADAGAGISIDEDGAVIVKKAPLNSFCTDLNNAPDLFPIVAVLAAYCPGRSMIRGVGRLSGKESDRASAILESLDKMGVKAFAENDDMVIDGRSLSSRILSGQRVKGGEYSSYHDHRMVMALRVAEMGADSPFEIDDTACVAKSFPEFLKMI